MSLLDTSSFSLASSKPDRAVGRPESHSSSAREKTASEKAENPFARELEREMKGIAGNKGTGTGGSEQAANSASDAANGKGAEEQSVEQNIAAAIDEQAVNQAGEEIPVTLLVLNAETASPESGKSLPPAVAGEINSDQVKTTTMTPVSAITNASTVAGEGNETFAEVLGSETELGEVEASARLKAGDEMQLTQQKLSGEQTVKIEIDQNNQLKMIKPVALQAAATSVSGSESAKLHDQPVTVTVHTPVQHGRWGNEFANSVSVLVQNNQQSARLQLNPAQLGPVDVTLQIDEDQKATIHFVTSTAGVKEVIENSLARLRDTLQEQGVQLADVDVSERELAHSDDASDSEGSHRNLGSQNEVSALADEVPDITYQAEIDHGLSVFV